MIFLMITQIQKGPNIIPNTVEKSICKLFIAITDILPISTKKFSS